MVQAAGGCPSIPSHCVRGGGVINSCTDRLASCPACRKAREILHHQNGRNSSELQLRAEWERNKKGAILSPEDTSTMAAMLQQEPSRSPMEVGSSAGCPIGHLGLSSL